MHFRVWQYTKLMLHVFSYAVLMNLLVYSYLEYQVPIWGYLGYSADYSVARHILANIGAIYLGLLMPRRMVSLTSFTLILVGSSTFVALIAIYAARGYSTFYLFSLFVFVTIVKFLAERLRFHIPPRKSSTIPIAVFSGGFFALCLTWIASRGGLSNLNFDISKIYSVREVALERYFVGPFAYMINWAEKIFGTTLFALGLVQGHMILIAFAVFGQVFFYAALGQKVPVAMLVFVIVGIAVTKYRISAWFLNLFLIFLIVISEFICEYGLIEPFALFVGRVFFEPSISSVFFVEFFSENKFTFFSNSFLKGIIDYQYSADVFDLISIERLGDARMNPNVGIIATGYQHMGYLGLLFYAVLAGSILATFESLGKSTPNWVPLVIAGPSMYIMFTSVDMAVALVTNGGIIAMVILFLWPTTNTSSKVTDNCLSTALLKAHDGREI